MEFSAPPAAEQGQTFRSMEERCRACEVMGGELPPCIHEDVRAAHERETGFPCPRREWPDRDGPTLHGLVVLGAHHETAHLFDLMWRTRYGDAPPDVQRRMADRLFAAFGDGEVMGYLRPSAQE